MKLTRVLNREPVWPPPIWLMRQAGRYLPEYRELRARAGSFWNMCNSAEMAAEVTLHPIRRFGFDAAIVFSDIMTVPAALGCDVTIKENEGPVLAPVASTAGLVRDQARWQEALAPVYGALKRVRAGLDRETSLIGFAGAPWTLATYLAAGRGRDEQKAAKLWAYRDPKGFSELVELLGECVAFHLIKQLEAGAGVVQLFDSWASALTSSGFTHWVVEPTKKIVSKVRSVHPQAKIIGFPRAATLAGYELYARETGVDAISVDASVPMRWARQALSPRLSVQGNLDPIALVAGGKALDEAVDDILAALKGTAFVFNLGHGVLQETPIAHVERLVARVRSAG
ncbi:MAG TPA: uroporphyrinogen decarboxylase [Rhizomicrobium sp.]|nr:uroporphyrinogen decarboxylase [Rhizomicrobium sp.]